MDVGPGLGSIATAVEVGVDGFRPWLELGGTAATVEVGVGVLVGDSLVRCEAIAARTAASMVRCASGVSFCSGRKGRGKQATETRTQTAIAGHAQV